MITIAPVGSNMIGADYICDGLTDVATIQGAIDAAESNYYLFYPGVFYIDGVITITNKSEYVLSGCGPNTKFYNTSNDFVFKFTSTIKGGDWFDLWNNPSYVEIKDMIFTQIDPLLSRRWNVIDNPDWSNWGVNKAKGINFDGMCNSKISNCYFYGLADIGISFTNYSWNNRVDSCHFWFTATGLPNDALVWPRGAITFEEVEKQHDMKITNCTFSGLEPQDGGNVRDIIGIAGGTATNLEINLCKFEHYCKGNYTDTGLNRAIYWGAGNSLRVANCSMEAVDIGVDLHGGQTENQGVMISNNDFFDVRIGVLCGGGQDVMEPSIIGNLFKANHFTSIYPIHLYNIDNIVKENHIISDNKFNVGAGDALSCIDEDNVLLRSFIIQNNWYKNSSGYNKTIYPYERDLV